MATYTGLWDYPLPSGIWNLPLEEQKEIIQGVVKKLQKENEEFFYSKFLEQINEFSPERQDELKMEYQAVYDEMMNFKKIKKTEKESTPDNLCRHPVIPRAPNDRYRSGNFLVFWFRSEVCFLIK